MQPSEIEDENERTFSMAPRQITARTRVCSWQTRHHLLCSDREIDWRCCTKQNGGNLVLRCSLGSSVATNANALLSPPDPEPAPFLTKNRALRVQQGESDGPVGGNLHEERTVRLNGSGAHDSRFALRVLRLEPHRRWYSLDRAIARNSSIERQQICIVPIVERGGMPAWTVSLSDQHRIDQVLAGPGRKWLQTGCTWSPEIERIVRVGRRPNAHQQRPRFGLGDAAHILAARGANPFLVRQRRSKPRQRGAVRKDDVA